MEIKEPIGYYEMILKLYLSVISTVIFDNGSDKNILYIILISNNKWFWLKFYENIVVFSLND